jgi:hypothetical protein
MWGEHVEDGPDATTDPRGHLTDAHTDNSAATPPAELRAL